MRKEEIIKNKINGVRENVLGLLQLEPCTTPAASVLRSITSDPNSQLFIANYARVTPQQFTNFWYKFLCQSLTSKLKCQNIWMTWKEHSREETGILQVETICSKLHLKVYEKF